MIETLDDHRLTIGLILTTTMIDSSWLANNSSLKLFYFSIHTLMFLYHHFYENSMSGASSYVQVYDSTDPIDAFDQMSQDIQLHLSCVELADKIYISNAFQAWMDA